jgi:DNA polymerase III delta prime subunit
MPNFFKKIIGWLIALAVIIGLTILGIQAFFAWKNNEINQTRLEIEHSGSLEERKRKQEEKDRLDKEHKEAQIKNLQGWQASDLDYNVQAPPEESDCMAVVGVEPDNAFPRKLIYSDEITQYFRDILQDLEDLVKLGQVNPSLDERNDKYAEHFKRRNMVMYGAPGTGKTELIVQLARMINEKYLTWIENELDPSNPNYELLQEIERKPPCIIQIDGTTIKAPGKGSPVGDKIDSHEKLIKIIEKAKEFYYGDKYSDKPYIVFIEEADQGCNVLDKEKGKLLEDWKNFLSTPRDSEELKGGAQDKNSCIIIATNNYDNIDPALFRRGRLGKKLNFNWNPNVLKKYLTMEFGVSLPESESWQWDNNPEPEELYKMCTKIGYDIAKNELAKNMPIIVESWARLSDKERKVKEQELGTRKNEQEKEVCNWLLHYLFTFHQYNNKRQLPSFNDAKKTQRYNYGHQYRMEELQRNSIIQLCNNIMALKDALTKAISEIRGEMAANFQEVANLRQELTIARTELKRAEHDISDVRNQINLNTQMSNTNSSKFSHEIADLQSQINSIVNRINNLGSGSSSGGENQAAQKYKSLSQTISQFTRRLNDYIKGGGSDIDRIRDIINNFIDNVNDV